jgi:hypothetical protein
VGEARGILHRLERYERRASIQRERALAEFALDASEPILLGFAETLCTEPRTRVRDRFDERCRRMKGVLSAETLQSIDIAWNLRYITTPIGQF